MKAIMFVIKKNSHFFSSDFRQINIKMWYVIILQILRIKSFAVILKQNKLSIQYKIFFNIVIWSYMFKGAYLEWILTLRTDTVRKADF